MSSNTEPPQTAVADELIGQLVAEKYRVVQMLAHGGMGRVYKGIQEPLGRPVAVKIMAPVSARPDRATVYRGRFFREASICSKLTHPNTVVIHDYGVLPDETYYLVMEYLEGRTLRHVLFEDGPFTTQRMIHVARQISGSLMDAHEQGVIHRDLKPPNVLVVPRGGDRDFVKVVDFGLVKHLDAEVDEELTGDGMFVGSPVYMAPEQFFDRQTDQRSEIYALGVIMYELLVGQPPFPRTGTTSTQDIIYQHMSKPVPPLSGTGMRVVVPPEIEALLMRCLSKRPDERPQSMAEVHEILHSFEISILSGRINTLSRPMQLLPREPVGESGPTIDISVDVGPDATPPHSPNITGDRFRPDPRQLMERSGGWDRPMERSSERSMDRSADRSLERSWSGERSRERSLDRPLPPGEAGWGSSREMSMERPVERRGAPVAWVALGVGLGLLVLLVGVGAWWVGRSGADAESRPTTGGEATPGGQLGAAPAEGSGGEAAEVSFSFASTPSGATVLRGEQVLGETPMELRLPYDTFKPGELAQFVIKKEGYVPRTLSVHPQPGSAQTLNATLEPEGGKGAAEEIPPASTPKEGADAEPGARRDPRRAVPRRGPGGKVTPPSSAGSSGGDNKTLDIKLER